MFVSLSDGGHLRQDKVKVVHRSAKCALTMKDGCLPNGLIRPPFIEGYVAALRSCGYLVRWCARCGDGQDVDFEAEALRESIPV